MKKTNIVIDIEIDEIDEEIDAELKYSSIKSRIPYLLIKKDWEKVKNDGYIKISENMYKVNELRLYFKIYIKTFEEFPEIKNKGKNTFKYFLIKIINEVVSSDPKIIELNQKGFKASYLDYDIFYNSEDEFEDFIFKGEIIE